MLVLYYRLITFFVPTIKLQRTPQWIPLFAQMQRRSVLITSRVIFAFATLAYPAHYIWIDRVLKKPLELWFNYRMGMAAMTAAMIGLSLHSWFAHRPRVLFMIFGYVMCYWQVQSMLWFEGVPYAYAFVMAGLVTIAQQMTLGASLFYLASIFLLQKQGLSQTTIQSAYLISAGIMTTIFVATFRTRMSAEIDNFIEEQTHIETQKKLIQSQMELNTQIRAFLPSEIYKRVIELINTQNIAVHEAVDEVLKLKTRPVACIFTDIRGFTKKTKSIDGFIYESAGPNLRASTALIERHQGIPRLIGDLIFTYFDSTDGRTNLYRALNCAIALFDQSRQMNLALSQDLRIQRYLLISFGNAVVGNVGGADGSREITVLGNPANVLSRIDELTKKPEISSMLVDDHLILSAEAANRLQHYFPNLELKWIDVHALSLTIRDFPEEKHIVLLPLHLENRAHFVKIQHAEERQAEEGELDHDQARRKAV